MRRSVPGSTGFTSSASADGAAGEEPVVLAVEEQQDRHVGKPVGRRLEVEVDRDRDPAHVRDLHVEDHEVGVLRPHGLADVRAPRAPRAPRGRDPASACRTCSRTHEPSAATRILAHPAPSARRLAEEVRGDRVERVEVDDVVSE